MLHAINAEWVSAIASAIATVISAVAIGIAVVTPRQERLIVRASVTHEILQITWLVLKLFDICKDVSPLSRDCLSVNAAKAHMMLRTLEVLIVRTELTDGAVVTASGAIALMEAVVAQHKLFSEKSDDGMNRNLRNRLSEMDDIYSLTLLRASSVINHAINSKWPKWNKLFVEDPMVADLHSRGLDMTKNQN